MLTKILAISGKPGLFKLISGNKRMLIVESLVDGKRGPVYGNEQINALSDIAMYTEEEEVALSEVFAAIQQKEGKNPIDIDVKKASAEELRNYLGQVLPTFDRERVHNSDIKKLIQWYNLLLKNGLTNFTEKEVSEGEEKTEEKA
ncbi:MAG: DUF5606 domain-containing protein [Paludibacteraceae bacterium]|nr:DUF5606 domain-containing protein [Paludibacteraceae bacterium]